MKNEKLRMNSSWLMAVLCLLIVGFTSCQGGDWDDFSVTPQEAYGNNDITEHNVITIEQLKAMPRYKKALTSSRDTMHVTDDVQLKLRITGNDIGGNIYNYVSAQDANGDAILIYVYAGGLFSYLPVGQEILINLKGLYVGSNGTQPCVSTPYMTSSGNVYPKNMSFWIWQDHFKITGFDATAPNCQPAEYTAADFDKAWKSAPEKLAGKLVKLKGITIREADGKNVWGTKSALAAVNDFNVKRYISGVSSNIFVNTSTSAKFAAEIIPTGKLDLTAVVVRYNNDCQLTLRTANDAVPSK